MKDLNKIKKVAIHSAQKAGKMLLVRFKNFDRGTIKLKQHREIMTQADLASEKIILDEIKKNFPDHQILSEESGSTDNKSDFLWIVDPIDGTTNFSIHNPLFAISIGVAYKGKIVLGVIFAPFLDELYITEKGKGATLNGKKIKVSGNTKKALHAFCHGPRDEHKKKAIEYYEKQKLNEIDCRQLGSASIELAYVATGRLESIMIPGARSWDVAAGVLMVEEAGGKVTDFSGCKWSLDSKDMLATNKKTHQKVLKTINNK